MPNKPIEDMTPGERRDLFTELCNWLVAVAEHREAIEALFADDDTVAREMSGMFGDVEEEVDGLNEPEMDDTSEESND